MHSVLRAGLLVVLAAAAADAQERRPAAGLGFDLDRAQPVPTVTTVVPDTTATDMGLREGDVIVELDGQPVSSMQDMIGAFRRREWYAGDELRLRVRRRGEVLALAARLREAAPSSEGKPAKPWKIARWGNLPEGAQPPSLASLRGKVVVLFCFTST